MNIEFKFKLGDKVIVPYVGVNGEVDRFTVYRDGTKSVLVRWAYTGGVLHSAWFTEKELKMAAHPQKPKPKPKPKPEPRKTAKRKTGGIARHKF